MSQFTLKNESPEDAWELFFSWPEHLVHSKGAFSSAGFLMQWREATPLSIPGSFAELSLVGKGELRASPWPTLTPHLVSSLSAMLWDSTSHELVHLIILISLKR